MSDPVTPFYADLGARLRSLRIREDSSLKGIERRSGGRWQAGALRAWEAGARRPDPETVAGLAEFYEVSAGWLLAGESDTEGVLIPAEATS